MEFLLTGYTRNVFSLYKKKSINLVGVMGYFDYRFELKDSDVVISTEHDYNYGISDKIYAKLGESVVQLKYNYTLPRWANKTNSREIINAVKDFTDDYYEYFVVSFDIITDDIPPKYLSGVTLGNSNSTNNNSNETPAYTVLRFELID